MKTAMNVALGVGAGMVLLGCTSLTGGGKADVGTATLAFDNASFYNADGEFDVARGKDAVIALMKYHGYPVYDGLRESLWVSDYGTGQFTKLGLAAVMFQNNEDHRYMLMDLFLLPNQMLPEHWHLETDKNPAKLEGWLIRHGRSHVVGEGVPNLSANVVVPDCHMDGKVTVEHEVLCGPGDFASLNRATARHWQFGGPEGAIITEVATVHDNGGVRHSDPAINTHFLAE